MTNKLSGVALRRYNNTVKAERSKQEIRIRELEAEGMTRSDAQGVYDAEWRKDIQDRLAARP